VSALWRWLNRPPVSVAIAWACFAGVIVLIVRNYTPIVSQWDWWQGFVFAVACQTLGAALGATCRCRRGHEHRSQA
jgi:hypothetical protein